MKIFPIPGFRRKRERKKEEQKKKKKKKIKPGGKWHVESFKYQLRCLNTPTRRSSVYIAHIRRTKIKLHTPKAPTGGLEKFPCFPTICVDRRKMIQRSRFPGRRGLKRKKKKKREKREREKKSLEISIFEGKRERHEEEIEDR